MHRSTIFFDFEVAAGEVCLTFQVANLTSGVILVKISNWELVNSDFLLQMEHTINSERIFVVTHYSPVSIKEVLDKI